MSINKYRSKKSTIGIWLQLTHINLLPPGSLFPHKANYYHEIIRTQKDTLHMYSERGRKRKEQIDPRQRQSGYRTVGSWEQTRFIL